ncbi:hypothetical protein [Siccirubricoccus sp. G192]|uniref:hypothetical protein n=1 Tax=Siccirubricoccus sp. G192 TaxID=2849651 RepID=UPI001C2C1909|nr:hypothetical protein [Siccirubricoccus sp. G192]MBV1798553.1 hypothetical protein [Siccirubricoccus sp. G192]
MTTAIYIDSNVWNWLFESNIDLWEEFPADSYEVCITNEIILEVDSIPEDKNLLREFAERTIKNAGAVNRPYFGFCNPDYQLGQQRAGGFGSGVLAKADEVAFKHMRSHPAGAARPTGLEKHEADDALCMRSLHNVVLTLNMKNPFKAAYEKGGNVVFLNGFESCNISLREFVEAHLKSRPQIGMPPT